MTSTKQLSAPRVEDPHHVRETYADALVWGETRDGQMHLTFAAVRPRGYGPNAPDGFDLEIVQRMVLTRNCVQTLKALLDDVTVLAKHSSGPKQ